VLLGVVALTLVVYRGYGRRSATGEGPVVAFSIPFASLEAAQAALQQGGSVPVPFALENLSQSDGAYRVEAWASAWMVGATSRFTVAVGTTYHGQVEVVVPAAVEARLVDLYVYEDEGIVPLAQLRLWLPEE
jgi:hypothetical protein